MCIVLRGNPPQGCKTSPATGERAPPLSHPGRPVLYLPTAEGWKAELTLVVGYNKDGVLEDCPRQLKDKKLGFDLGLVKVWP